MGVGSKAKKRRVPLKETSAAEIDDCDAEHGVGVGGASPL